MARYHLLRRPARRGPWQAPARVSSPCAYRIQSAPVAWPGP